MSCTSGLHAVVSAHLAISLLLYQPLWLGRLMSVQTPARTCHQAGARLAGVCSLFHLDSRIRSLLGSLSVMTVGTVKLVTSALRVLIQRLTACYREYRELMVARYYRLQTPLIPT